MVERSKRTERSWL